MSGFLQNAKCKVCGVELQGEGSGRPAESYLGTYNGLCYTCTSGAVYIQCEWIDGARTINYPPHCPAWRRDRETFIGYADCPDCKGGGRKWVTRSDASGGSYTVNCKPCLKRFYDNPTRKKNALKLSKVNKILNKKANALATGKTEEEINKIHKDYISRQSKLVSRYLENPVKFFKPGEILLT